MQSVILHLLTDVTAFFCIFLLKTLFLCCDEAN